MDYNKIKTFLVVIEEGGVSSAARALHRTQSAISQQIQVLESELGVSLFESLRGRLLLSAEGKRIYDSVASHFRAIEDGVFRQIESLHQLSGRVRIGSTPSIGHYYLTPLLARFKVRYPMIDVELILQPDEQIESLLLEDELDVGFIINFTKRDVFQIRSYVSFEENLVCSQKYLQSIEKSVSRYTDLVGLSFIDFDFNAPNITHWLKKNTKNYRSIIKERNSTTVVEDNECVKRMVLENMGIAALPDYMVANELESNEITKIFSDAQPTLVGVDLAMRRKKNLSRVIEAFIQFTETNRSDEP